MRSDAAQFVEVSRRRGRRQRSGQPGGTRLGGGALFGWVHGAGFSGIRLVRRRDFHVNVLVKRSTSAVFDAIWNIKPRLFGLGGVANPRDSYGYRSGLRLAQTKNPSVLFVPSSVQHC
ncbi:MAG: hypothetical protein KA776_08875, partial [Pseudoxanthomonas sp.]|nr:hypothetical protein [Pseudoxanthomonas sp.]